MTEEEYQEYPEPETLEDNDEEYDERGKLRVLADYAMQHPRWSFGAGAGLTSFVIDLFVHFNPVAVLAGIGAVVVISWQADGIAEEAIHFLAPGSNQEQVGAIASHIANRALGEYPIYRDQRPVAKFLRLIGRGDYSVEEDEGGEDTPVLPRNDTTLPKRAVKSLPPAQRREIDPVTQAINLLVEDKINADQLLAILDRIGPQSRYGNGYGNAVKDEHEDAPEDAVRPQIEPLRPTGWDEAKKFQLVGAYLISKHLDDSLKAIGFSTSQRNRDHARAYLKKQGVWEEK